MAEESFGFQAEVSKLLDIVANSLYSNKAVFLRELISNSSDACDRLRYAALTQPELIKEDPDLKVMLSIDLPARTITIADNGIGMNREDLVENLGTIARSGTAAFMDQLTGDKGTDMALIGQFGIGFYSAFMVAERVDVLTHKAGEQRGWRWRSCGKGEFTIAAAPQAARGTAVTLHLRKGEGEFLDPDRIRRIVQTYSDHIPLPIVLKGAPGKDGEEQGGEETLNAASALWVRPKSEITPDQYKEFYHHVGHAFDDPWLTLHTKVEGVIAYTSLLFVPSVRPIDLFDPDRKHRIKLYVRRVFVTDDCEGLMPSYLRFVRGIVDSEDLPLNISREMLQHNPVVGKIRSGLVKRILDGLKKRADNDGEDYAKFWDSFGAVLKEGIYEDSARRDELLELSRFRSTAGAGLVSLSDYVARMAEGQDAIFHITGEERDSLAASPQIEGLKARGVEVLLLTDPVDDFWVPAVGEFQGKPFRSATKGGVTLDKIKPREGAHEEPEEGAAEPPAAAPGLDALIALLKEALKGAVKDVRVSERLTESPVCLVADEGDMDMHLERMLMQHQRVAVCSPRILEINPSHELIRRLAAAAAAKGEAAACQTLADAPHLLLDQARIVEGEPLPDPGAFSRRLARVMERGLPEGDSNR